MHIARERLLEKQKPILRTSPTMMEEVTGRVKEWIRRM